MLRDRSLQERRAAGFTIVEVLIAMTLIVTALIALIGVLVSVSQGREEAAVRYLVLERAQNVLEEIKATDPAAVGAGYDKKTYTMTGVVGANADASAIQVDVIALDPSYLQVTVTGSWFVGNRQESLQLYTEIFNANL